MIRKLIAHAAVMLPVVTIMPWEPSMALAAEQNQNASATFAIIVGQVRDGVTKNPIADAIVVVTARGLNAQFTVKTDSLGRFQIQQFPGGQEVVVAVDAGRHYRPVVHRGNRVTSGATKRFNIEMVAKP